MSSLLKSGDVYGVVLAGGSGTRFWPRSRQTFPKQLCRISSPDQSMIEETLQRVKDYIPIQRRLIVTHAAQKEKTSQIVGSLCEHIIAEPVAKNTAAALIVAAFEIKLLSHDSPDAVMVSLHADHVIKDQKAFISTLERAIAVAREGSLTLLGIVPNFPETGYGYIQRGAQKTVGTHQGIYDVLAFKEKPSKELAQEFIAQGHFYWNSGMFVWKVDTLLSEMKLYQPELFAAVESVYLELKASKQNFKDLSLAKFKMVYDRLPSLAIDHAVLEKSNNRAVVAADFGWFDVGSWRALEDIMPRDKQDNLAQGDVLFVDTRNTTVVSDSAFVAALGLEDLMVVVDKGCVLVCPKSRAQDVKVIVERLKEQGRWELT